MNEDSSKIWSDIPKGRLMIPRYYFSNGSLSINMLMNKDEDLSSVRDKFISYIDGLAQILDRRADSIVKSVLTVEDMLKKRQYIDLVTT